MKFLHNGNPLPDCKPMHIMQGYLMLSKRQQLRVRIIDNHSAFLCYKIDVDHNKKDEYEYQIPLKDGIALYNLAEYQLQKQRKSTYFEGNKIDIDLYHNGLIIIEVEITDPEAPLVLPPYCGRNVTGDDRYTNIAFAKLNQ